MKTHPVFPSLLLIGFFSLSLLRPSADSAPADPVLTGIAAIEASETFTCALTTGGGVKCWGENTYGQLGDGTVNDRHTPWWVSGLSRDVTAISVGRFHACALTSAGAVKCWGANNYGQLGNNSNSASHVPVDVSNLSSGVTAITAGDYHTCALTSTGAMKCWGRNYYGQLGDNSTNDRDEPVAVSGMASGVAVISAGGLHTCAVTSTGRAKCWGHNLRGQLGDNSNTNRDEPVTVSGMASGVAVISAGGLHTCARMTNNILKCWGGNHYGQLGNNSNSDRDEPVSVLWLASIPSEIVAGGNHTCARNTDGGVKCWGSNSNGQVGDNTTDDRDTPTSVSGLSSGAEAIGVGHMHSCTVMTGGGVKCWGINLDGQVGDGTTDDRHIPVNVVTPKMTFRSVAARDGWVLESGENSGVGGSRDAASNLNVGDNDSDRQYRSILYFNTGPLPDGAVILRVTLKIKLSGVTGADPLTTHGDLRVDIQTGTFGAAALENADFEAAASKSNIGHITALSGVPDWYKLICTAADHDYINKTGVTQFRLRFATDDNDDNNADFLAFFAGEAVNANRPTLIIEYYLP